MYAFECLFHEDIISVHSFSLYIHKYINVLFSGCRVYWRRYSEANHVCMMLYCMNVWRIRGRFTKWGGLCLNKERLEWKDQRRRTQLIKEPFHSQFRLPQVSHLIFVSPMNTGFSLRQHCAIDMSDAYSIISNCLPPLAFDSLEICTKPRAKCYRFSEISDGGSLSLDHAEAATCVSSRPLCKAGVVILMLMRSVCSGVKKKTKKRKRQKIMNPFLCLCYT